jgi:hypothetical protein
MQDFGLCRLGRSEKRICPSLLDFHLSRGELYRVKSKMDRNGISRLFSVSLSTHHHRHLKIHNGHMWARCLSFLDGLQSINLFSTNLEFGVRFNNAADLLSQKVLSPQPEHIEPLSSDRIVA